MTTEQLLAAINASGLTAEQLTFVLQFAAALVKREQLRAAMAKERAAQSTAVQASEAAIQALQAQFDQVEAQLAAQS
jgi:phage regulator Rha-like protein